MNFKTMTFVGAVAMALPAVGAAEPDDDTLILNGEIEMTTKAPAPAHLEDVMDTVMSGWHFRSDETQVMQADDFDNPGMMYAEQGREIWNTAEGSEDKSCASCHGTPDESMQKVRATYPKWNDEAEEVRTIQMQVNDCRENRMGAEPWAYDKEGALPMEALIASVGRGETVDVATDGPAEAMWEQGKELYYTRTGQLELGCVNCHEDSYGMMIRADHLSQGQINGFPVYRLKNARLTGAHSRFKGCIRDTRAETYSPGSPEFVALELYVASRGNGLSVEGPSVRN